MAPRRTNNNELSLNEWEELRTTLCDMQENIQLTIQQSMRELTEAVFQQQRDRDEGRVLRDDGSTEGEDNPFVEEGHRRNERMNHPNRDREDRSWETGFKVDIPESHGGVRGEELLDWLVAVQELLEFKRVPDNRKVALVATNLGRPDAAHLHLHFLFAPHFISVEGTDLSI